MLPPSHVDALLHAALSQPPEVTVSWWAGGTPRTLTASEATRVGRVLLAANADSVNCDARLSDLGAGLSSAGVLTYFGYLDTADGYSFHEHVSRPELSAVRALGALSALVHHSERCPDWESSEARAVCEAMERAFIALLPGFDDRSSISYTLPESRVAVGCDVLEEF